MSSYIIKYSFKPTTSDKQHQRLHIVSISHGVLTAEPLIALLGRRRSARLRARRPQPTPGRATSQLLVAPPLMNNKQLYPSLRCGATKGVRRRGLTGLKPPPPKFKKKIIIYSFKYGAFYVLQFVQRSHFITIVYGRTDVSILSTDVCAAIELFVRRVTL